MSMSETIERIDALTPMEERHIRSWVTALRSGRYHQTTGNLKDITGYCCLGVACDVFRKAKKRQGEVYEWTPSDSGGDYFLDEQGAMPGGVADWFGLASDPGLFLGSMGEILASSANDDKKFSLKRIASMIERTYLKKARGRIK